MNIKIPTIGSRGDVQPFIALAQGLVCAGHQATVLTHPVMRNLVENHNVPFAQIGPDVDMEEVTSSIRQRSRNPWAGLIQAMRFAFEMLERSHEDIMAACQGADLMVISASGAAGKNEAELLGNPMPESTSCPGAFPILNLAVHSPNASCMGRSMLWLPRSPPARSTTCAAGRVSHPSGRKA